MPTICPPESGQGLVDRDALHALGVVVPMRFRPVHALPGRHPLGRAGDGMRILCIRPYEPFDDNPRDIDKFSPPGDRQVVEWEHEARASVALLADNSGSMALPAKWALRNTCLLQLTYSFWRAGDSVGASLFAGGLEPEIRAANLRTQMQRLPTVLAGSLPHGPTRLARVLESYRTRNAARPAELVFLVSDFLSTGNGGEPGLDWPAIAAAFRRNLVPVIIGFRMPRGSGGIVKALDPERNVSALLRLSARRLRRIDRNEDERIAALVQQIRAAGLDSIVVTGQRQVYPALARLARTRRLRAA